MNWSIRIFAKFKNAVKIFIIFNSREKHFFFYLKSILMNLNKVHSFISKLFIHKCQYSHGRCIWNSYKSEKDCRFITVLWTLRISKNCLNLNFGLLKKLPFSVKSIRVMLSSQEKYEHAWFPVSFFRMRGSSPDFAFFSQRVTCFFVIYHQTYWKTQMYVVASLSSATTYIHSYF